MTPESLSRATARAVSNSVCGGKAELTPTELAGCLSGLSYDAGCLAWWKYLGDDRHARRMLETRAALMSLEIASKQGWEITRNVMSLRRLAITALNDEVNPRICPGCNQASALMPGCKICNGTGRVMPRALWRMADIGSAAWHARWKMRYKIIAADIGNWVGGLDREIRIRVGREC